MATQRAVLLVLTILAAASAKPINLVVSDCDAINSAFTLLKDQFENATTPAALSMTLTLNCTADWTGCSTGAGFVLNAPANSTKQPKVTISIKTDCKKGQNVTIPYSSGYFFIVDTQGANASLAMSMTGPITFLGSVISQLSTPNTKNTLKAKDVSTDSASVSFETWDLESVSITGGLFKNGSDTITAYRTTKSVTISKATFDGYETAAIALELPANTKVSVTGNTFKTASSPSDTAIKVTQADGKMNINLAKTTTDNSSSVPICITSPANITKPVVSVAGSVGITPTKSNKTLTPAGWPTSGSCTIAEFSAA